MNHPRIVIHTHMSLDGKIMGAYLSTDVGMASQKQYYKLMLGPERHYSAHKGWMGGRITAEDNYTHYRTPELDPSAAPVPEGDFIAVDDAPMYYFSMDPSGVLAWERNELSYFDTTAHVVEILSGKASNAYKDFLRRKGISYLIAGEASVDLEAAVQKIGAAFGVDEIIVSGGGGLNWSFVQAGLCDEVSIVISPAADGTKGIQALFDADERYNRPLPTAFKLRAMQARDDGSAWLRYGVDGPTG